MKYRHLITVLVILSVVVLAGCGSSTLSQSVTAHPRTFQIPDSYIVVSNNTADLTYQAGTGEEKSVVQFAQSRVDSGVTIQQMASLSLQKLELSLPGYSFVEQSSRSIDCGGDRDGEMVSFITQQGDSKLFHSQYYTLVDGQGYVWSVSSTKDDTRKLLNTMIKSAVCE